MNNWNDWIKNKDFYEDMAREFAKHRVQRGQTLGQTSQFGEQRIDGDIHMRYVPHSQNNQSKYEFDSCSITEEIKDKND